MEGRTPSLMVRYPEPSSSNTSGCFYSYIILLDHQGVSQSKQDLKEKLVATFFPKWFYEKLSTGKFYKSCSFGFDRCVFYKLIVSRDRGENGQDGGYSVVCE